MNDRSEVREVCIQYLSPVLNVHFPESDFTDPAEILRLLEFSAHDSPKSGSTSTAYTILLGGKRYIIRKTLMTPTIKESLKTEIHMYTILGKHAKSALYIPNLLYADIPTRPFHMEEFNYAYFLFEYIHSIDLHTLLYEKRPIIEFHTLKRIISHIIRAIHFLGSLGIVHRDIKPQNILIDLETYTPYIIDFESSCYTGTQSYIFRGTEEYSTNGAKALLEQTRAHGFIPGIPIATYTYSTYDDLYALYKMLKRDFSNILVSKDKIKLYTYRMKKHLLWAMKKGGACPCQFANRFKPIEGGYKATKRNLKYLKKWKRGESIGFTMRSSLKAKGLIPRANGTRRVSNKYR
jgi:serine/threonine protein kinase